MNRTSLFVALIALVIGTATAAAGVPGSIIFDPEPVEPVEQPLISKSNSSGFVMAEFARNETCDLYADKVVITRQFGFDNAIVETKQIELVGDIDVLVAKAAEETDVTEDNFLCDGPGTFIAADGVILYSTGGCGSAKIQKNGPASAALKDMILTYCPNVF